LCLLAIGLAGSVLPVVPGHLIIVMAAVFHWFALRAASGVEWWTFVVLIGLLALSQAYEFASGAAGARWFGGTKWGAIGALLGAIAGIFFLPLGLILGPVIGAFALEALFAKQDFRQAATSGVGSAVGTVSSLVVKVIVGVAMVGWFLADVLFIG
ncbi:MAG: DUF456 domain-containing protein, partial [Anaerolineae bacterium]